MTRKAFQFKKTYEEVELADNVYRIEFTDDKVLQYNKSFDKFHKESKKLNQIDVTKITVDEQQELFGKMQDLVKKVTEELLGKGSYDTLYEASGNSLMNMIDMVVYLSEVVGEKTEAIREDRKNKYLIKKK